MIVYICAPHSNWMRDALNQLNKENMEIYLAGGATGNNNHIWRDNSKTNPEKPMEIFLAGTHAENNRANSEGDFKQKISILESFYYMNDWMLPYIKEHWNFLLDSGAFTFMSDKKNQNGVNWDEYLEKYAHFINENKIELFFRNFTLILLF